MRARRIGGYLHSTQRAVLLRQPKRRLHRDKEPRERDHSQPVVSDLVRTHSPLVARGCFRQLHEAGLIDPYVLFSLGDDGIARDYKPYRAASRTKLEEYMDKFVMPPAPAGK